MLVPNSSKASGFGCVTTLMLALAGEGVATMYNPSSDGDGDGWVGSLQYFEGGKGYWLVATDDFTFSYNGVEDGLTRVNKTREVPSIYRYHQSDQQAFFFIENAIIEGESLENDDVIIAYNKDIIVGSRYWNGEMTDVPAIGVDTSGDELFDGYCNVGDQITFKVFDASSGELITMSSEGVIEWSEMGMSVISLTDKYLPTEISLNNAYPNPFNPVTMLSYDVPSDMDVSLGIYDVRGRLVEELVNGIHYRGRYEMNWNASNHASGVYIVKLIAGTNVKLQKVMLVK